MAKLVSKTYGEALFEIAMEENKLDLIMEEVLEVQKILSDNKDLDKFFLHPGIAKQDKQEMVERVFKGNTCDEITGFLEIIISKERYNSLLEIFQYFIDRVKDEKKIGIAYITTAVELREEQKADVLKRILATTSYEKVEMHFLVDPAIIGGMIIRIKDRVVDSSIKTKLNELTKQLLQIQLG
ncbi:F0F1 ATP synthase subunit delta [Lachnospiraceae bacterium OttesenSCG-928-D06]|nr:F0F1 ATP synthase subunit delta [Lachnospiraceae bacterium OttesenSCG-928-D06]